MGSDGDDIVAWRNRQHMLEITCDTDQHQFWNRSCNSNLKHECTFNQMAEHCSFPALSVLQHTSKLQKLDLLLEAKQSLWRSNSNHLGKNQNSVLANQSRRYFFRSLTATTFESTCWFLIVCIFLYTFIYFYICEIIEFRNRRVLCFICCLVLSFGELAVSIYFSSRSHLVLHFSTFREASASFTVVV